jgi:Arc/MetJ-type ribon-helix-helix transcriptional regulator
MEDFMPKTKVAVTLESELVEQVETLVRQRRFATRSQAIETAVRSELSRVRRTRLAEACSRLDPREERALSGEGLASDAAEWPEY